MYKINNRDINNNIDISSKPLEFLNPDYIYIESDNCTLNIKNKEEIKKEQIVLNNNKIGPIFSSISGVLIGKCTNTIYNNKEVSTIVIKNNYKEELYNKKVIKKDFSNIDTNNLSEILDSLGIVNEDNKLLSSIFNKNIKYMVLKCFDIDPFINNSYHILKDNLEEILFTFDYLLNLYNSQGFILIKDKNSDIIRKYKNIIGIYPNINIKIMEDVYPLNNDVLLKDYIFKTKKNSEDNILFLSLQNIVDINNALRRNRNIQEKYITISGNCIKKAQVIKVKIGTSIKELLGKYFKFIDKDVIYITNSILCGYEISNIDNLIITKELNGLIINKKETEQPLKCINCGMCYKICPVNINPKKIDKNKCIKCGLCSFICPSKIHLIDDGGVKND